jgi:hypothetical protein
MTYLSVVSVPRVSLGSRPLPPVLPYLLVRLFLGRLLLWDLLLPDRQADPVALRDLDIVGLVRFGPSPSSLLSSIRQ